MIDRDEPMSREPDVFDTRCTASFVDEGIGILLNARIKRVSGKSGDSMSAIVETE